MGLCVTFTSEQNLHCVVWASASVSAWTALGHRSVKNYCGWTNYRKLTCHTTSGSSGAEAIEANPPVPPQLNVELRPLLFERTNCSQVDNGVVYACVNIDLWGARGD